MKKILIVDDDSHSLSSTSKILSMEGFSVEVAHHGKEAWEMLLKGKDYSLVLTDVRMPVMDGIELLRAINAHYSSMPVILMTAFGEVQQAVLAMKQGAVDFLTKPFKKKTLLDSVSLAIRVASESVADSAGPDVEGVKEDLVGDSSPMVELRETILKVAQTNATVLITGQSGVGKEIVARKIHSSSGRAGRPFIALNCASIPEHLIESELFGYEKGAFSGATHSKAGLFELAHRGTLFLDEIGDMPLTLQSKLLRVLQDSEFRRLGCTKLRKIDVRFVSATNRDLEKMVLDEKFRQDLFFRVDVIGIKVPSLEERAQDIPLLLHYFLKQFNAKHGKKVSAFSPEALRVLKQYRWPGNVRELINVVERAVVLSGDEIQIEDLPSHIITGQLSHESAQEKSKRTAVTIPLGTPLRDVENMLIEKTLEATRGDKNIAAKLLGVNSRTIYRKIGKRSEVEK